MGGLQPLGRDVDGAHAHGMRGGQIAGIILEHRGTGGGQAVDGKDRLKGSAFRFGAEIGVFNAVNRIKNAGQATGLQYFFSIGGVGVGIDDAPARQRLDPGGQQRIGRQDRKINVMHIRQIIVRLDLMFVHQPGQRGAVLRPVVRAQMIGMVARHRQPLHDPFGHSDLDLVKKSHRGRVKRVVQIKDPGLDMVEIGQGLS